MAGCSQLRAAHPGSHKVAVFQSTAFSLRNTVESRTPALGPVTPAKVWGDPVEMLKGRQSQNVKEAAGLELRSPPHSGAGKISL